MFFFHRMNHHHHHLSGRHEGRTHGCRAFGQQSSDRAAQLLERAGATLDLTRQQQTLLAELLAQLQGQRMALTSLARGAEAAGLLAGDSFDRESAQQQLDGALDSLRKAVPGLVAASGEFFDALDFEQHQALRFALRRRFGQRAQA